MHLRVAAIYDIHGNLPALEAVLEKIREASVDLIMVGGDVLPGPMPVETLTRLFDLPIPVQFIQGNGEVAVLAALKGADAYPLPEQVREIIRWTAQQLPAEHVRILCSWPKTLRLELPGLEAKSCSVTRHPETKMSASLG